MREAIVSTILALLMLSSIGLIGCSENTIGESVFDEENEPVHLKLKWLHQAQFTGNYVAKELGFYREEGLDVTIDEFSFQSPTIDSVVKGESDIGITGADELLIARAEGAPIKAIAVVYRTNPVCAYSLKKSNITKPHDFLGKTIGIERAADGTDINVGILYKAMMAKLRLNRSEVDEVTIGYDASELLAGEVDVSTGYIINEPNLAIEAGEEVNIILMADYGVNMYADVIFAREEYLEQNPDIVKGFLRATIKGWEYSIENEEKAIEHVMKYAKGSRDHQENMLSSSIPLIRSHDSRLGEMHAEDWQEVHNTLFTQGMLEHPIEYEQAYTTEYLE